MISTFPDGHVVKTKKGPTNSGLYGNLGKVRGEGESGRTINVIKKYGHADKLSAYQVQ